MLGADSVVPAGPTRERLRALARVGWSASAVAERAGWDRKNLMPIRSGRKAGVKKSTEIKFAALYRELAFSDPPRVDPRTVGLAIKKGWLSPLQLEI